MTSNSDESTHTASGLSAEEAQARLDRFGPNEPAATRHYSPLADLLHLFLSPLTLILLIAAGASAFLGDKVDAGIICAIVLLSAVMDFNQTYRSHKAVERLHDQVAPTATILRDGAWKEIPCRDVVPGDIARLSAGDMIPADARLLAARDLYVQQAALTGESFPSAKAATEEPASPKADAANMVFLGTSVVSGTATAEVVATGAQTAFGDIAARLAARPEETAFDRGLRDFSRMLAATVFFLVLFIIAVGVLRHRDPLQSLLFAVALAVGLTPEFLPMITAVTLSKGAVAMARRKVIVKHLSAIQNLGSLDVLCSDKTGTLTTGIMSFDRSLDAFGDPHMFVSVFADNRRIVHSDYAVAIKVCDRCIIRVRFVEMWITFDVDHNRLVLLMWFYILSSLRAGNSSTNGLSAAPVLLQILAFSGDFTCYRSKPQALSVRGHRHVRELELAHAMFRLVCCIRFTGARDR
jgi:Mg2+-importing ATPase